MGGAGNPARSRLLGGCSQDWLPHKWQAYFKLQTAIAVAVPPLHATAQPFADAWLDATRPWTVFWFGTAQLPPPVTTNSVASQLASAVLLAPVCTTVRNCGTKPGGRVERGSLMLSPALTVNP